MVPTFYAIHIHRPTQAGVVLAGKSQISLLIQPNDGSIMEPYTCHIPHLLLFVLLLC